MGLAPDESDLSAAIEQAGKQGYAAVVVKALGVDPGHLSVTAQEAGVAVLATSDDMDWRLLDSRVSDALRSLAPSDPHDGATLGDLFALANAVALSVGAAIAIEDRNQILCTRGGDFNEGIQAFLEKRKPRYGQDS